MRIKKIKIRIKNLKINESFVKTLDTTLAPVQQDKIKCRAWVSSTKKELYN